MGVWVGVALPLPSVGQDGNNTSPEPKERSWSSDGNKVTCLVWTLPASLMSSWKMGSSNRRDQSFLRREMFAKQFLHEGHYQIWRKVTRPYAKANNLNWKPLHTHMEGERPTFQQLELPPGQIGGLAKQCSPCSRSCLRKGYPPRVLWRSLYWMENWTRQPWRFFWFQKPINSIRSFQVSRKLVLIREDGCYKSSSSSEHRWLRPTA